jgi:hypothetical protein
MLIPDRSLHTTNAEVVWDLRTGTCSRIRYPSILLQTRSRPVLCTGKASRLRTDVLICEHDKEQATSDYNRHVRPIRQIIVYFLLIVFLAIGSR